MKKPKIIASHVAPPIPVRGFDWCAQYEDCEGHYAGWGDTEEAAITDLRCRYAHLWEEEI